MPSLRSRLFVFMLKHRHLLKLKKKQKIIIDETTSLPELREEVEKGADFFGKLPPDFTLESVDINGIKAEWMRSNEKKDQAILYFHGGGLVLGSIRAHRGIVAKFVKASQVPALVFDYALAPENPFPKGLNDCLAAYDYLLETGVSSDKIIFMGDSGGGNLVLTTLLALKEKNRALPAGAIALSPWTDLKNTSPSYIENAEKDELTWKNSQTVFSRYYCAGHDSGDPLISPVYGDLKGLPPILLFVGGDELMRDDSVRFAENAESAGVEVSLTIGQGLFHCYPACAPLFPEATQALEKIQAFIDQRLNR